MTLIKSHQPFKKHRVFSMFLPVGWEQKGKPESLKAQELLALKVEGATWKGPGCGL